MPEGIVSCDNTLLRIRPCSPNSHNTRKDEAAFALTYWHIVLFYVV
jgi:hypothetical protein